MEDYSNWPIKKDFLVDPLDGEIQVKNVHVVLIASMESLVGLLNTGHFKSGKFLPL